MNANEREFSGLFGPEMDELVGCAFEVQKTHGHGLDEKIYENSLVVEFRLRGIPYAQQERFSVSYKGEHVGTFAPNLIAHKGIVIETKTIDRITDHERGQALNYLRITGLEVGLILNFKHPKMQWDRIIHSEK